MMIAGTFEPQTPPLLSGSIATEVLDPGSNPANVIHVTDAWKVHVTWSVTGSLAPLVPATGKWRVRVYSESIGPGLDQVVASKDYDVSQEPLDVTNTRSYDENLSIPANTLAKGLYKIVTVITIDDNAMPVPNPIAIAAFGEGPFMQFF